MMDCMRGPNSIRSEAARREEKEMLRIKRIESLKILRRLKLKSNEKYPEEAETKSREGDTAKWILKEGTNIKFEGDSHEQDRLQQGQPFQASSSRYGTRSCVIHARIGSSQ